MNALIRFIAVGAGAAAALEQNRKLALYFILCGEDGLKNTLVGQLLPPPPPLPPHLGASIARPAAPLPFDFWTALTRSGCPLLLLSPRRERSAVVLLQLAWRCPA